MQIAMITPEREARFAEWRDRWIKIGLSTEPADFDKAEKAALRAYALCDLERPKVILRMGSPYGATVGGAMAWLMLRGMLPGIDQEVAWQIQGEIRPKFGRHVIQKVYQLVRLQVEQQIEHHVGYHVTQRVSQRVDQRVWRQVGQYVSQQVWRQVWRQVRLQLYQHVGQRVEQWVERQVRQQVSQQVWRQVDQQTVPDIAREGFGNSRGGAFWADWCAYVTFMRDVLGWNDPMLARFTIDEDLATSCGWVWWSDDVLAISDRPSEIHRDAEGWLHNESGPSIAYRDGWKLYHIHSVPVPDFVVEHPDTIKVDHIEKETNAEVRRVMIARMGMERFVRESGLQPVHSDDFGTLYRKEMPDDEPLAVVKVVNSTPNPDGSRKEYFLRVPPTMRRAREAVAWTFGMEEKEYRPVTET